MLISRLSRLLLALGAAVGIGSVVVLALEMRINLPDWLVQVAMVKLAVIASLGLLGAGAVLGRHARRQAALQEQQHPELGAGTTDFQSRAADRERVHRPPL